MRQIVAKPTRSDRGSGVGRYLLLIGVLSLAACDGEGDSDQLVVAQLPGETVFVGGQACAECHQAEADLWLGSHHDLAMQEADTSTVLGDFNDTEFTYAEVTTRFFNRDSEFWVSTDGPDGELAEYRVVWAFGAEPLQQYIVEIADGSFQTLSIAWDSRVAEAGGQRWFHLYPDEAIDYQDPLHWTGVYQSWNTTCADCHSTKLIKGYDPEANRFDTEFASIDVDCEACHGPGSAHIADPTNQLTALPSVQRSWVFEAGQSIAARVPASATGTEIEVCAQCHSRRAQLTDTTQPGDSFYDAYRPAVLEPGLYHADGQILDEVYVYGSFLQSAMAAAGVTCSDCHEPHSGRLRADGNALCAQCHLATTYDQASHHRHEQASAAAECTACHMRAETYMVVDPRRDHSFRVPRPDLSVSVGSPNACNDCHNDQTNEWAAEQVAEWFPGGRQNDSHFATALHAGRSWAADAQPLLAELILDEAQPAIARASALSLLAERTSAPDAALIESSLNRDDPMLIIAAIDATALLAPERRVDLLQRFLTDDRLAVRIGAGRILLSARSLLSPRRQLDLDVAIGEYLDVQAFNSDRPEGLLNIASVAVDQGRYSDAERIYLAAIERHPNFSALSINLSDLYRLLDRADESEQVLRETLTANPGDAGISFSLALAIVRNGRPTEALPLLSQAAAGSPEQPYYQFVRAIALNDAGDSNFALQLLRETHERFPGHADTLFALATMLRDDGEIAEAYSYAERLIAVLPGDPGARALLSELAQQL